MKFFFDISIIVNVVFAINFSFLEHDQGKNLVYPRKNDSDIHDLFHNHFAHAISVMKYYRRQQGWNTIV